MPTSDPHVVSLRYRVEASTGVDFENAGPVEYATAAFNLRLEHGELVATMTDHFSTVEDARQVVEELLRAWEVDAGLQAGRPEFVLKYEGAEVVDRGAPSTSGEGPVLQAGVGIYRLMGFEATLTVSRARYPAPPTGFAVTPDVESMWMRYDGYTRGKEPLLSMAYFCLSVVQSSAGGRRKAAQRYRIDSDVLDKLGELTSRRGDSATARKYDCDSTYIAPSSVERAWIEAAIK